MGNRPTLHGRHLALIMGIAIICLTLLGLGAQHEGIDGASFAVVVAAIAAIVAGAGGWIAGRNNR